MDFSADTICCFVVSARTVDHQVLSPMLAASPTSLSLTDCVIVEFIEHAAVPGFAMGIIPCGDVLVELR